MKRSQGNQHVRPHVYDRSQSQSRSRSLSNITRPPAHTVRTHSDYEQRPHYLLPKKTISKFDPAKQHRQEQRYHYHSDRDLSPSTSSMKVSCYICKKRYPSSKFLYAHMMRFHPEKGMKGVLPPQKAPLAIKSSDERSTTKGFLPPPRVPSKTHHVSPSRSHSSVASDVTEPNLDCDSVPLKALLSWGQKDRRGRSACPSNHAVTSGQQKHNETVEETKPSSTLISSQQKRTCRNSSTSTDDDIDNVNLVTKMSMMMMKMKTYECNICHKEFESGQALGGHKSSSSCRAAERGLMKLEAPAAHDDEDADDHGDQLGGVLTTMATMMDGEIEEDEIVEDGDITDDEGIQSHIVHDFDLNELPPEAKDDDI